MTATVDILLATLNGSRFLPELLRSIEGQTYSEWRLIVRDDGSQDLSPAIIAEFAQRHRDQVRVLGDERRRLGACANFGVLLEASDAPYFMFCDQDDVWLTGKIGALLGSLRELEDRRGGDTPLLVHSDLSVVDEQLRLLHPSFWRHARLLDPATKRSPLRLMLRNYVTGCASIGNAALRRAATPIPGEAYMHDWWVALVAAALGDVGEHEAPTVLYRQHHRNDLGAQSRHPWLLVSQFLRRPAGAVRHVQQLIQKAQQQAAVCEKIQGQSMRPEVSQLMTEFSQLRNRNLWQRKLFLVRSGLWPDDWLASAICWFFM